jgi:multidrug efflux pump subunit AcrA (membrane-fusion protein)
VFEHIWLSELQTHHHDAKLVSPVDGKVTYVSDFKGGDQVSAYQSILTVGDTRNLMISFDASNSNLLSVGMKARITSGSQTVTGTVITLPSMASSPDSQNQDQSQSGVGISLDKVPTGVSIGDFGQVEIVIAHKDNTMIVPKRAVQSFMGEYTVQVWDGTSKKEYKITPGIQSDTAVEVLSGLSEGQNVILN